MITNVTFANCVLKGSQLCNHSSQGIVIVTSTCVSLSFILFLIAFYEGALEANACYIKMAPWIFLEMFDASWGFFGNREVVG